MFVVINSKKIHMICCSRKLCNQINNFFLGCWQMVGILDYGLAKVADLMIKHVITPAVDCGSPISFTEETNQDSGQKTEMILKIVSCDPKVTLLLD